MKTLEESIKTAISQIMIDDNLRGLYEHFNIAYHQFKDQEDYNEPDDEETSVYNFIHTASEPPLTYFPNFIDNQIQERRIRNELT